LILPDTTLEVACQRAEEVRKSVKQLNLYYQDRELKSITLSLGVSVFPEHGITANALLHSADLALYRAKEEGRDRLKVAEAH
jgi:diguanylate cyclase (GGDEF)-like protein